MKKTKILTSVLFISILTGCYYHKEEDLYPAPCSNADVTYSATITGLLTSYSCTSCHSGPAPSGNFSLVGYNNVKAKVTDNTLLGAISHASGFSPMPQGGPKMSDCDISKIKKWIDAGALQN